MTPVKRLTDEALETHNRETLLEAFVAAARFGVDLELPFEAAAELGLDAATLVAEAEAHLTDEEAERLHTR